MRLFFLVASDEWGACCFLCDGLERVGGFCKDCGCNEDWKDCFGLRV